MGAVERRRNERLALRNRIVEVTLGIVAQEGWEAVTIRRVASAIDYTPPIVYEHFENKESLLQEIIVEGHKRLYDGFSDAVGRKGDARKALKAVSLAHWRFAMDNDRLYRLMFDALHPLPNEIIFAIGRKIEDLFLELTSDKMHAKELMFNWACVVNGYTLSILKHSRPPDLTRRSPDQLFERAIDRFLGSISQRNPPPSAR